MQLRKQDNIFRTMYLHYQRQVKLYQRAESSPEIKRRLQIQSNQPRFLKIHTIFKFHYSRHTSQHTRQEAAGTAFFQHFTKFK